MPSVTKIDAFPLKATAVTAMTVDHVGALLSPEVLWLRLIGRLAMPISAFPQVEGYCHKHNIKRYMMRLLGFARLAQGGFTAEHSNIGSIPGLICSSAFA
ncbi:MAG: hypothetical protein ACI8Z5_002247 [Lentimonas sp.]